MATPKLQGGDVVISNENENHARTIISVLTSWRGITDRYGYRYKDQDGNVDTTSEQEMMNYGNKAS